MHASRYILLVYLKITVVCSEKRLQRGLVEPGYVGRVEKLQSVKTTSSVTLLRCTASCSESNECVSFFFNRMTGQCILHSKIFNFQQPSVTEVGWNYYNMQDATGRCPSTFVYYRHLDFCYMFAYTTSIDYDIVRSYCQTYGGKLAGIESEQKFQYFTYILINRTYTRVLVDGYKPAYGNWTLEDGTPLTYFHWYPSQPSRGDDKSSYLGLMHVKLWMYDVGRTRNDPAGFICEY